MARGMALASWIGFAAAMPALASEQAVPLTVGPTVWSSPVVTVDGYVLALARDRAGVRLVALPFAEGGGKLPTDAAPTALVEVSNEHEITAIARGSRSDRLFVVRRTTRDDRDELVAIGTTPANDSVLLTTTSEGERLVDPTLSPDGESLAVVARREPRTRGETVSTRVLVLPSRGGELHTIAAGDGDCASPSFLAVSGGSRALAFVRTEGEYTLWTRVALAADGTAQAEPVVAHRDRARWRSALPLDPAGTQLLVIRDLGHGPALWRIDTGTPRAAPLTTEGRAAKEPALTADGGAAVFVAAAEGGLNLFALPALAAGTTHSVASAPFDDDSDYRGERVFTEARATRLDAPCRSCHDHERGLDGIGSSAHARLACVDCHVDVTETPHRSIARSERLAAPLDTRGRPVRDDGSPRPATGAGLRGVGERVSHISAASLACGSCHRAEAVSWRSDVHGRAFDARSVAAPGCPSCHGDHDVWKLGDARSRVSRLAVAEGCSDVCHEGAWLVQRGGEAAERAERAPGAAYVSNPLATYRDSIHAKKLRLGKRDAATCASCHTAHAVLNAANAESSLHPARSAATCAANGKCHVGAPERYASLVDHVVAVPGARTPRQYVDLGITTVGVGTVAWAGSDVLFDALRRLVRRARVRARSRTGTAR